MECDAPDLVIEGEVPEGQGYLVANVYDAESDKTHLCILDAENVEAGPIGKAMMDHRVPFGFHGNWMPMGG